ncbi:thiamine pyrophosphate-binding protein [bacterium]|nr:thiamine pyrophosphate-binding protein [bacterium]MBU4510893.1 thiamine pyrophosphate-binding protein [bacterium]
MIKLSDYVIQFIENLGVKYIFLLPGGGSMHLVDSVGKSKKLNYVCNLHEQACAIAADAYGQYTNNLGVALVTTGPGGTNTITGVAAAWLDSTPMLIISGQVKRADMVGERGIRQMGFQEINIVSIVKTITKYAITVTEPEKIRYHLEKAVSLAKNSRPGPVWIDIPLDVQAMMIDEEQLIGFEEELNEQINQDKLNEKVSKAIQLLNQSERPVILVGNGVRLADGIKDFLDMIDLLQIPVLTTWKAIDFLPEDHPLFVGRPGAVGQRGANFTQQNSDFILSIGARLDFGQTGYNHKNFARAAKKVIVDIDPNEIKKLDMPIEIPICCDAKMFIRDFIKQKNKIKPIHRTNWLRKCKEWQIKYPVILKKYWKQKNYVNNYVLIDVLSEEMSENDLLVPGSSGASSEVTMQAFRVKKGQRIFNSEGLGPMGCGIPASIGGCIASGRKRTVCIDGDGGFYMNVQDLETVKRLNLPIKFFVLNNQGYASIRNTQNSYFEGRYVASDRKSGLTLPNTRKIADAFGISFIQITNHKSIREKVREVLNIEGPVVCEVILPFEHVTAPKLSSYQKKDGSFVSKPLEDLWPFLDREEFKANMIVKPIEE